MYNKICEDAPSLRYTCARTITPTVIATITVLALGLLLVLSSQSVISSALKFPIGCTLLAGVALGLARELILWGYRCSDERKFQTNFDELSQQSTGSANASGATTGSSSYTLKNGQRKPLDDGPK